ncbi:hypothetical protein P280DRAFT_471517 [Massarina eburnea CBS 473.64]|uniref:AA9 family lytic polysaccharide monooxygenase n=1 Tax=Massarina eburnea CBS 473.64 TaxID=1395130 RepID=A0A6A6RTT4_9PLEO|nr:hypothetical protein P280DRAFT_471517 [Massarina eburnea CBS 473.64]
MFSKTIIASTLIAAASAHQNFHQFWVNDVTPGYQAGIRMPPSNSPVTDVTSDDMACNVDGSTVPSGVDTIAASEGDSIKVQWDQSGHPGPITHMLFGPVDDASQATGIGSWVKIDELDYVDGKWANEIMEADNMTHTFTLPTGLASGEYLLRSEMLALHGAQTVGGAQFYIGCAQLKITGTGSGTCSPSIDLPGAYNAEDSDIYIPNIYNGFDATNYTAPGGSVATCGGSGSSTPVSTSAPAASSSASNGTAVASSAASVAPTTAIAAVTSSAASSAAPVSSAAASSAAPVSSSAAASSAVASSAVASSAAASSAVASSAAPVSSNTSAPSSAIPSSSAAPSTLATSVKSSSIPSGVAAPSGTGSASSGSVAKQYYQCGGAGWTGATTCVSGSTCTKQNDYYSQCI